MSVIEDRCLQIRLFGRVRLLWTVSDTICGHFDDFKPVSRFQMLCLAAKTQRSMSYCFTRASAFYELELEIDLIIHGSSQQRSLVMVSR